MKIVFISYHYHPYPSFRSSLVHNYFLNRVNGDSSEYIFLHADWDHHSKSRYFEAGDSCAELIKVPKYSSNLSWRRVWSHFVFSWRIFQHAALKDADFVYICVPPSLTALGPAIRMNLRKKPWVLDLVDLWPEALPVSPLKKIALHLSVGWIWIVLRNWFYSKATKLISHCRFFLQELDLPPNQTNFVPLAQSESEVSMSIDSARAPLEQEIRILVLGSINHVLDCAGLIRLIKRLQLSVVEQRLKTKIIIEILGAGESKAMLIDGLVGVGDSLTIVDHGVNFDPTFKHRVLARCHFGYNGYSAQTAIGITYKSIDFASRGLVFLNSVKGDLRAFVSEYGAGINYTSGEESAVALQVLNLNQAQFDLMSLSSRKIFDELFLHESFIKRMDKLLVSLQQV